MKLGERLFDKMQRRRGGVGLEIGPRPVSLDGVAPLRDLPLEFRLRFGRCPGQVDLDAVAGRLDVADIDLAGASSTEAATSRACRCRLE